MLAMENDTICSVQHSFIFYVVEIDYEIHNNKNCFVALYMGQPKFRPKILDLGHALGAPPPKGEKTCVGPICTITQNFTPICATVSERKKQQA